MYEKLMSVKGRGGLMVWRERSRSVEVELWMI